jgi:subtilisin family serine protease
MRKSILIALLGVLLCGYTLAQAGVVDPELELVLDHSSPNQPVRALAFMTDRVDLHQMNVEFDALNTSFSTRHETVIRSLQEKAAETQGELLDYLEAQSAAGKVESYRGFWIDNSVVFEAPKEIVYAVAKRQDVAKVFLDYYIENIKPTSIQPEGTITGVEPGLKAIRVDEVWALGITGEGQLVSHLDTGVDGTHPALAARWRGLDPQYAGHPEWAWFDPNYGTTFPRDYGSHGTHTMGTVCGANHTSGDTVGVAIDAEWISAGVIDIIDIPTTIADAKSAFQWIADPDGDPGTTWDVPGSNSNSWGISPIYHSQYLPDGPCDSMFWGYLRGAEAAGVVVVFSAGNEGPGATTHRNPANWAADDYTCFSVGAVDGNDPNLPIASFSSRGPEYCTPSGNATIKPEICAPGVNVRSSVPGGGYSSYSGTSMASPHINGVIALMRQANPNLPVNFIKQVMMETALDKGNPGEDNTYGWGVVDAYEAVLQVFTGLTMSCEALVPTFCRGGSFYFRVNTYNSTGSPISVVMTFNGYAGYDCDPGNSLVAIPRNKTIPDGQNTTNYFFNVPNAAAPGQYSASLGFSHSGQNYFCCMNVNIVQCSPWKVGDNTEWSLVEVNRPEAALPTTTSLAQNYPNPFNATTEIGYALAEAGKVELKIYNLSGQLVETLVDSYQEAGEYLVTWDGSEVSSGVYFCELTTADYSSVKRMSLLK